MAVEANEFHLTASQSEAKVTCLGLGTGIKQRRCRLGTETLKKSMGPDTVMTDSIRTELDWSTLGLGICCCITVRALAEKDTQALGGHDNLLIAGVATGKEPLVFPTFMSCRF